MTIKIELSDAARQAFRCAYIPALAKISWAEKSPAEKAELECEALGIAISAALEAMVEEGTAFEGVYLMDGSPMLYIHLGGKP